ncbi:putative dienelactone hydrolase [Flavobacterium enshiense DK69]|uniref:Dienelactone hydrolase n=1 Tax=Flavobacterium enshiense DK69 TaxID=1107311 RepID=V6SEM6_9FLAO|nr:dienelactone hydrolase family protein [Flavobacterium enshiense]ESU22865.1 putative dienelactone hydrolase [Flavobacterium enshiense DK69]KGO93996.1 dienelactone hydrolase [Flavobacterium enshiense DK69]
MKTKTLLVLVLTISSTVLVQGQLKAVSYADGNQKLEGFSGSPKKSNPKKAGVLILPAWMGIDAHSKESAEALSKLGYYTFVADIYGVGNKPANAQEAGKKAGHFKTNYKEYQKRIHLALEQLIKSGANPNDIAVIGYCFGGSGALEAARANMNVKGVVSFHGGLGRDAARSIEPIKPKVLVLHGADDFYVSETEIKAFQDEMRTSKADWQMVYYADAVHAFTQKDAGNDKSKGVAYNEKADKRSWKAMLDFFGELFQ